MINNFLPYQEQKALEAIARHHGVDSEAFLRDMAIFANWVRTDEKDKGRLSRVPEAPFLIVLLGQMGIYTKSKATSDG